MPRRDALTIVPILNPLILLSMLDLSPPILALLVAAAVAMILLGILGRRDRVRPTCRACGRDAREAVAGEGSRCACGADLGVKRAVRWPRRPRRRLVVAGVMLALGAAAFGWLALHVRTQGGSWWTVMPAPVYEMAIRHRWERVDSGSLGLRLGQAPDRASRERLANAAIDAWVGEPGQLPDVAVQGIGLSLRWCIPNGRSDELVGLLARSCTTDVAADPNVLRVAVTDVTSWIHGMLVRVDRVRLGDRELAWSLHRKGRSTEVAVWHRPWSKGIEVQLPPDVDLMDEAVRRALVIDATMALAPFGRFDLTDIAGIVSEPDPERWGVDVLHAPFSMKGLAPPSPTPRHRRPYTWLHQLAGERWQGRLGAPVAPSVAVVPLLEGSVLGLALGAAIALATAIAVRVRAPRCSLGSPACRGCGSTLGPGMPLPPRCSECGRPVAGADDAAWTARGSRSRLVAAWCVALALVAGAAFLLERQAAPPLRRLLASTVSTPEREVRWLVRETIAMRPWQMGPSPSNRLHDGSLDSQQGRLGSSPELLRVAADEILHWAAPAERCRRRRRIRTRSGAERSSRPCSQGGAVERDAPGMPAAMPEVFPRILGPGRFAAAPSVVRRGAKISADPTPYERVQSEQFPTGWFCQPDTIHDLGPATVRVTTKVLSDTAATLLLETSSEAQVLVVAADAARIPKEYATAEIARAAPLMLAVEEGGSGDALFLGNNLARGVLWVGRWEVLGPDGAVLGSFESSPQGGESGCIVALPDPWPETLTLRFTPADTWPGGRALPVFPHGVFWQGVVQFTFARAADDFRMSSKVTRYRVADAVLVPGSS
jgi:hypothetical protein